MYTNEQILEAAEAAVQEKGADYVYSSPGGTCVYAVATESGYGPSCLVGHIVFRLSPEEFRELAIWDATTDGDTDAMTMVDDLNLGFTDEQAHALRAAQVLQDQKYNWGESLDTLKEKLSA